MKRLLPLVLFCLAMAVVPALGQEKKDKSKSGGDLAFSSAAGPSTKAYGVLYFDEKTGKVKFEGNPDESAKAFFESVQKYIDGYVDRAVKAACDKKNELRLLDGTGKTGILLPNRQANSDFMETHKAAITTADLRTYNLLAEGIDSPPPSQSQPDRAHRLEIEPSIQLGAAGSLGYKGSIVEGQVRARWAISDRWAIEGGGGGGRAEKNTTGDGRSAFGNAGILVSINDRWRIGAGAGLVYLATSAFDKAALHPYIVNEVDIGNGLTVRGEYNVKDILPYIETVFQAGLPTALNEARGGELELIYTRSISPRVSVKVYQKLGVLRFQDALEQTHTGGYSDTGGGIVFKF
jgi:hypothetical protein